MIFDTDVIIWAKRGNKKAAMLINNDENRFISIQSYMELMQCAKDKIQHKRTISFLKAMDFTILPLTENIGHRASIYVEEYTLSNSIKAGDAIIGATAIENDMELVSSNYKHFKCIKELQFRKFKP